MEALTMERMESICGGDWLDSIRAGLSGVSSFCRITIMAGWVTLQLIATSPVGSVAVGGFLVGCIIAMGADMAWNS